MIVSMSINSNPAAKLLKGSEGESRIQWNFVLPLLAGGIVVYFAVNFLANFNGAIPFVNNVDRASVVLPINPEGSVLGIVSPTATVAVYGLPTTEAAAQREEQIREMIVEVVVTATPTLEPRIEYIYEQVQIPVEVTRIVEVAEIPLPTVTPIPLAPGTIEICASVEGAKALYIGGVGVVSGACALYTFAVGQTTILVQVDK
jgi:hypothetical protein